MCQEQAKQEHDDYWQAVTDVAENVVSDLDDADDEDDRDELISRLIAEKCDQHEADVTDKVKELLGDE